MPHYNSFDSFKTKKSIDKKNSAKKKTIKNIDEFIVNSSTDYGIVIEVRYNDAYILYKDNLVIAKIRKDLNIVCNQVVFPGDKVVLEKQNDKYVITNLVKRTSLLSRIKKDMTRLDDVGLTKNIAANVDIAVIVVAAKNPPLHPKFIDRYLMVLQNNNIPVLICLNKCDLKTDEDNILDIYRKIKIPVVETSTYDNIGIETLKEYIKNKQAIFVGNSGVGKSSLINAIMENNEIKTGCLSNKSNRGKHTTTTSKYYIWDKNSSIIDTPGIRSLDVSSFSVKEIENYFKEFKNIDEKCKYKDCLHYKEKNIDCAIKRKVEEGLINKDRYESYIRIIDSLIK